MNKTILVFAPYYPPHVGGLENYAEELNRHLEDAGFDIFVFTPLLPKDSLKVEVKYKNVQIFRFPAREIIPNYPVPEFWNRDFWNMYRNLKKYNYTWVVSHTRFFLTSVIAGIYARKNKINWLHIEHGSDYVKLNNLFKSFIAKIFDHTLGKWVLRNADKVVTVSKASAFFCNKIYRKKKYQVIYRGVDLETSSSNLDTINKPNNEIKILFAGRLIDGKGVLDLLKSVKKLKQSNWVLFVVGDGPQKKFLVQESVKLGINHKVTFFGQKNRSDLLKVINSVDIIVNPSYTEGLPTLIIEAAKLGKAIIATDVGGTREIIEDNKSGFLVAPKNIQLLSKKIEKLIVDNELRVKFGKEAKKTTNDRFNWRTTIKDYENILLKNV